MLVNEEQRLVKVFDLPVEKFSYMLLRHVANNVNGWKTVYNIIFWFGCGIV